MLSIVLPSGKSAQLSSYEKERVTIRSPESSPPGSTVSGTIEGIVCPFQMKVQRCRKDGEIFIIDGKIQNATREIRSFLEVTSTANES